MSAMTGAPLLPPPAATPVATPAAPPQREYDQIVSADVKIKKLCNSDNEYKITFVGNVSKVLMYQTWSPTSATLNADRAVKEVAAKKWVKAAFPNPLPTPTPAVLFTPTCVMEHRDDKGKYKKYVFVLNNAKVNKRGEVVFRVSSKDIDKNSTNKDIQKLKKIPTGHFHNARFDIDKFDCRWLLTGGLFFGSLALFTCEVADG
jgi:hypothetical protein